MHEWIEEGKLLEVHGPQSLSYILEDDSLFNLSEYKILHNQDNDFFVDCAKLRYNGKIKLTYFLDDYVSLRALLPTLEAYTFVTVLTNLLDSVVEIVHNGYLDVADLNLEFNRIYVDPASLTVRLIYVPLNSERVSGTVVLTAPVTDRFRAELRKLILNSPGLSGGRLRVVSDWLDDKSLSLEDVCKNVRAMSPAASGGGAAPQSAPAARGGHTRRRVTITALNAPEPLTVEINKPEFRLGRSKTDTDCCLLFNAAIGRMHCRIFNSNGVVTVEDADSRNGTFVNKVRLKPHERKTLHDQDVLRLANSDFSVRIEEIR